MTGQGALEITRAATLPRNRRSAPLRPCVPMTMPDKLLGEDVKPVIATCDATRMATGEPGLPRQFVWHGRTIEIEAVLRSWHEQGRAATAARRSTCANTDTR